MAGLLLIARLRLISGRFCIIPAGSGIEHFFRNYTAVLRFFCLLSGLAMLSVPLFFLFITWLGSP